MLLLFTSNRKLVWFKAIIFALTDLLAERTILVHLRDAQLISGDLDAMLEARLGAIFMPHGLGHFVGLDVHDCGGYLGDATPRSPLPGLKSLRVTRTLQERMVM